MQIQASVVLFLNLFGFCLLSIFFYSNMPPTKDYNTKSAFGRSHSNNGMSMSAKIYHPATNLMPLTPPQSPTGVAPSFGSGKSTSSTWGRQNSNGKYSWCTTQPHSGKGPGLGLTFLKNSENSNVQTQIIPINNWILLLITKVLFKLNNFFVACK